MCGTVAPAAPAAIVTTKRNQIKGETNEYGGQQRKRIVSIQQQFKRKAVSGEYQTLGLY